MAIDKTMEVKIHEIFEVRLHGNTADGPVACLEYMPECVHLISISQTEGPDSGKGPSTFAFKFLPLYPAVTYIRFRLVGGDAVSAESIDYHIKIKGLLDVKTWRVRPIK